MNQAKGMPVSCQKRGVLPTHGPYAQLWFDEAENTYRIRLTEDGKREVEKFLEKYPRPICLLISTWPVLYRAALAAGFTQEEIESLCLEGAAWSIARYDPSRCSPQTVVAWGIRASVGNAVSNVKRHSKLKFVERIPDNSNPAEINIPGEISNQTIRYLEGSGLTGNEKRVLRLSFGMDGRDALKRKEIAALMNLTIERIRQLYEKAIKRIQQKIGLEEEWKREVKNCIIEYLKKFGPDGKQEISRGINIPYWQVRDVLPMLMREEVIVQERELLSKGRWRVVYKIK